MSEELRAGNVEKMLYNPKIAQYGDEYMTPYARTFIDYPREGAFIIQTCIALGISMYILNRWIFLPFAQRSVPPQLNKTKRAAAIHRFNTAAWKFVSYGALVAMGVWALWDQQHWFWDTETYASMFKNNVIPWRLRRYYLTEISYYLFSLIAIAYEPRMKDRLQMVVHHFVTLTLMFSSYYLYITLPTCPPLCRNTLRYGVAVMILHDIADPLLELAKLFNYMKQEVSANIVFFTFMCTFVYTRVYIFPKHIIYTAYRHSFLMDFPFIKATMTCFVCLWILHIIWSYMVHDV